MPFHSFEFCGFIATIPSPSRPKPRIFLVQPQRLFMDALRRILSADFEVAGAAESLCYAAEAGSLDLILIDADAAQFSEYALLEACARSGAVVCLLSVDAERFEPARRGSIQPLSKCLTQDRFVESLLRVASAKGAGIEGDWR